MIEMVAKINTFINNSTESSLLIQYDLRWKKESLVLLALMIVLLSNGIFLLGITFYPETLIVNKGKQQLTHKVFSLLGTKSKHYSFAQIQELILESYTNKDEDGDEYTS